MKKTIAVLVIALLNLNAAVHAEPADTVDRLKSCSQLSGAERSACIDKLLQDMAGAPEPAQPQTSTWIVSETTSPVDYTPQISAQTMAQELSQGGASSLTIHCRTRHIDLLISTAESWKPSANGEVKVVYRINEQPAVENRWKVAAAGRSLVFPGDAERVLRAMPDSGQITVRVHSGSDAPSESTFQLTGLDAVRRKLAATCNLSQLPSAAR